VLAKLGADAHKLKVMLNRKELKRPQSLGT